VRNCTNQAKYTADRYRIPVHSFKTIYNGINTGRWTLPVDNTERSRIRAEYQMPADAKVIILTAAFRVEKNHIGAVRALDILHKNYPCKPYLLLVGSGVTLKNIRKLVTELKLQEYVKFTDIQKDVRPFYWASDLFTLCSTSVETFSIAALEAMGCGLPCVLTDIGGASEMIMDGVNGYLCKPDEKDIAQTWLKVLNGNFSGEVIYDYVSQRFGLDKMLKEYMETFDGYLE
jgi:glycosyltransferase involved in cell wall biosynthesis